MAYSANEIRKTIVSRLQSELEAEPREDYFGCGFFMERGMTPSTGPSTHPSYSPGPSRNAECSNCKLLLGKIKLLEVTVEMHMHPEQHTLNSTALLHEVYNDMGKLDLK
ncbi:hypothetical protein Tco_0844637 [Tanacetum coccineum]